MRTQQIDGNSVEVMHFGDVDTVILIGIITTAWRDGIDRYLLAQRAAGAPATTLGSRKQHLQHLARHIGVASPWELDGATLEAWCGLQEWKPETRRGRRTTFRSFYKWATDKGHCLTNPALALPKVKASAPAPRPLPDRVYHEALIAARPRERMMLRLGAETGLRRAEVAQVHSDDIIEDLIMTPDDQGPSYSIRVHGKGSKERVVPLTPGVAADLLALPYGYAFPGADNGHLSPRWVGKLITKLMPGRWTMHTLRHRFATRTYSVDRDVFTVQELLGHASPATTRRYVVVPRDGMRRTVLAAAS